MWQTPLMLYTHSITCFLAGLSSVVISPLTRDGVRWGNETKTIVVYLVAIIVVMTAFAGTSLGLYSGIKGRGGEPEEKERNKVVPEDEQQNDTHDNESG